MGADDDVDLAVGQVRQHPFRLLVGLESAQRLDADGEFAEAFGECGEVLLNQQRGRDQDGDLLAVLHGFERGPQGDLGLAVPDVAADQPVHGNRLLHVGFDLVDARQLIRGLGVLERVLEFALPGRVRAERVAGRRLACGVQTDQLRGDLLDGLAGAAFGLGPVRSAELVDLGFFAPDVAADRAELIGGDEQAVRWMSAFARRVLDHQVLPVGPAHIAVDEFDEASDAVLVVDDEVTGLQRQWVHLAAATRRHLGARRFAARLRPAGEVPVAEHGDALFRPLEPRVEIAHREGDGAGRQLVGASGHDIFVGQDLGQPGGRAGTARHDRDPPAVTDLGHHVGDRGRGSRERPDRRQTEVGGSRFVGAQGGQGDPVGQLGVDVGPRCQRADAGGDRGLSTHTGGRPGSGGELPGGAQGLLTADGDPIGFHHHSGGTGRQQIRKRDQFAGDQRRQGFHSRDGDALGHLEQLRTRLRMPVGDLGGPGPHLIVQQQFADRIQHDGIGHGVDHALVGDCERAQLLDGVAPQFGAHRMLGGGGEHVDDPAAHGELTPPFHQVAAFVAEPHQPGGHLARVDVAALRQDDGFRGDDLGGQHLHERPDGGHDDVRRGAAAQGAHHGHAGTDDVSGRGQSFVRQGLPGGVQQGRAVGGPEAKLCAQPVGLTAAGGDDQQCG